MNWFVALVILVVIMTLVGFGMSRVLRWAGERGWVYNKYNPRPRGSGIPGFVDQIYQPSVEHVIDEQTSESTRADQDESGDKPDPGATPENG
ncbi:MAG: hypothetical protein BMS9Abin07_1429 [Acidimicrobiia bacterium]|nr:MAG: hypothetical protein BMS9Abin07_1429 [Acidimicrobiia bacterium]